MIELYHKLYVSNGHGNTGGHFYFTIFWSYLSNWNLVNKLQAILQPWKNIIDEHGLARKPMAIKGFYTDGVLVILLDGHLSKEGYRL